MCDFLICITLCSEMVSVFSFQLQDWWFSQGDSCRKLPLKILKLFVAYFTVHILMYYYIILNCLVLIYKLCNCRTVCELHNASGAQKDEFELVELLQDKIRQHLKDNLWLVTWNSNRFSHLSRKCPSFWNHSLCSDTFSNSLGMKEHFKLGRNMLSTAPLMHPGIVQKG